jgi:hypothetical protein
METTTNEFLGLVVARQQAICAKLAAAEQKKDERLSTRNAAFMATCLPYVWESAADLMVPHYEQERRELQIPMRKYGMFLRANETIIGLRVRNIAGTVSEWRCKINNVGELRYTGNWVFIDDKQGDYDNMTKQQFEQSFLEHMARVIPSSALQSIEPVTHTEKKGRRRVVAMA